MYSALKRDGAAALPSGARRAERRARAARASRSFELALGALGAQSLELEVLCSKGTYMRVLAEDIAAALGTLRARRGAAAGRGRAVRARADGHSRVPGAAARGRCCRCRCCRSTLRCSTCRRCTLAPMQRALPPRAARGQRRQRRARAASTMRADALWGSVKRTPRVACSRGGCSTWTPPRRDERALLRCGRGGRGGGWLWVLWQGRTVALGGPPQLRTATSIIPTRRFKASGELS